MSARAHGLWRVMGILGLFLVLVQIHRAAGAVLAGELVQRPGLAPAQIGVVVGAMFMAAALVQLPYGMLFDRFGPRRVLSGMGVVAIAGIVLFAVAGSATGMVAGRLLIGVGHGGVIAGIFVLAVAWVPPERMSTVCALVVALAGGLGGLLATAPLAFALDAIGLQATFLAIAAVTALITGLIYLLVEDAPAGAGATAAHPRESFAQSLRGLWLLATDRKLWPIYAMGACFSAPFMTVGGLWAGPYLREVHGLGPREASYLLFAMIAALNLGTLAYGPLDRILGTRKWLVLGGALAMEAALLPLALMPRPPLALAAALLVGFAFCCPFYVTLAAHCRAFVPAHRAGRAIACINLVGISAIFLLQGVSGLVVEAWAARAGAGVADGYRLVFALVAGVLALSAACYLRVRDAHPSQVADDG